MTNETFTNALLPDEAIALMLAVTDAYFSDATRDQFDEAINALAHATMRAPAGSPLRQLMSNITDIGDDLKEYAD